MTDHAPLADRRPAVVHTIADLRHVVARWRRAGERVALVPTMGALHDGHLSLVRIGLERAERVVVSIFVNPTQFAPHEDFQTYPRTERRDLELLELLSTDLVFAPSAAEIYPLGFATRIEPQGAALGLETETRPHFFGGVATVVAKLIIACAPDLAVFGEKDFQQLAVVRQMVRDLALPVDIVGAPTVREPDGLAMSSRNAFLSDEERRAAPALHRALVDVAATLRAGGDVAAEIDAAKADLTAAGFGPIDYLDVRDAATLAPWTGAAGPPRPPLRILVAARLGRTRLIDNCAV